MRVDDGEIAGVLVKLTRDVFRVGTLNCDGTPAELMAVREASARGLAVWRVGVGYGITDAGRAWLQWYFVCQDCHQDTRDVVIHVCPKRTAKSIYRTPG